MKSLKKLTAVVAMAAVCLAMITPVRASAALTLLPTCAHSGRVTYFEHVEGPEVIDTHTFLYETEEIGEVYVVCEVTEKRIYYGFECWDCHDSIIMDGDLELKHSKGVLCPFSTKG